MKESDFFGDDEEITITHTSGGKNSINKKSKGKEGVAKKEVAVVGRTDKALGNIESLSLGKGKKSKVEVETLVRDVSKLTNAEKLVALTVESPELVGLIEDMNSKLTELNSKISPLWKLINDTAETRAYAKDDLVDYLEVKQQLLLSYCLNITFYLYLKSQGRSVKSHPVMKQLLELRYVMEKMRPLDAKLQHQIDRLVGLASADAGSLEFRAALLRPNPAALLGKDEDDEDDDDDDDEEEEEDDDDDDDEERDDDDDESEIEGDMEGNSHDLAAASNQALYKAPKMMAAPYSDRQQDKRAEKMEKKKKRLANTEIMDTLREEFGVNPEVSISLYVCRSTCIYALKFSPY